MKLIINNDRTIVPVGTWGTKNENNYEVLHFEFPQELQNYNKRIVYYLGDEKVWDAIVDDKAYITNAITKYERVKAYVWCTRTDDVIEKDIDFRTKLFEMNFYENENADGIIPTEEQVDGFNTMLTAMSEKIDKVDDKIDEIDEIVDSKIDEIDTKIDEVNEAVTGIENLNIDVSDKVDGDVTVTLTKKDNTTKTVVLSDGTSLMFQWIGTSLGIKTEDEEYYTYVDLQGIQGPVGPKGEAFTIKKTYSSVSEMNADFNNMQLGDYVMIASTVEIEDNAKLYTRGEESWIFISDFSGAQGIKGETGATPNIQIGSVVTGTTSSVTRSGTNENPIFNFVLEKGEKGDTGDKGEKGDTGNGIASIEKTNTNVLVDTYTITYTNGNTTTFTVTNAKSIVSIAKTSTAGLVDTYTITYNDGTTSTFEITNGQDGEVTQEQLDEVQEQVTDIQEFIESELDKVTTEKSTRIDITGAAKWYSKLLPFGRTTQKQLSGSNKFDKNAITTGYRIIWASGLPYNDDSAIMTDYIPIENNKPYVWSSSTLVIGYSQEKEYLGCLDNIGFNKKQGNRYSEININDSNVKFIRLLAFDNAGSIDVDTFQVNEGSTLLPYEEYCGGQPSPSPDFPQPIENVEGRSCRNLFNKNGDFNYPTDSYIDATTLLEDGTIQTTANAQSSASRGLRLFLKPNTNYIVSGKLVSSTGTGYTSKARVRLMGYETSWGALAEKNLNEFGNFSFSFNSGNNSDWFLSLNALGTSGNNYVAIYDEIQINEGSTALPYEPYFEGKRLELNVCNKQLFNKNDYLFYRGYIVSASNPTIHYESNNYMVYIPCKTNTNYTISKIITKRFAVGYTTEIPTDGTILQSVIMKNDTDTSISIQTGNDAQYLVAYIRNGNISGESSLEDIINSLQIEEGSTATSYEEHKEQMIPFPLAEGQKLMEGDYLADDGVHHVRGQVVLKGNERFSKSVNYEGSYYLAWANIGNAERYVPFLCNRATYVSSTTNYKIGCCLSDNAMNLWLGDSVQFPNADIFKQYLTEQYENGTPIIIEYELAEEVIEPYTEAQAEAYNKLINLLLYKGVNHIWTNTDGLEPNLQLTYYKSNKLRLDSIEARLELLEN